jgi:hypothetical protein
MKTKLLIGTVVVGNLAGFALAYFVACGGWPACRGLEWLGASCWAVLALPLGWLGLIAGRLFATSRSVFNLFFYSGAILNACLWGWAAWGIIRAVQRNFTQAGFDASAIAPRIAHLRESHATMAHVRARPLHARKGLLAAAGQAVKHLAYFSGFRAEHPDALEQSPDGYRGQ